MNSLAKLQQFGQKFWLDELSRDMLEEGVISRHIQDNALAGITTNPAIFQNSISHSQRYDGDIAGGLRRDLDSESIFQALAIEDVTTACDTLRPLYEQTDGLDGYVSLEVSPRFAYDKEATLQQAQDLWNRVDRPNLYIKVPGTPQGLEAVEELIYRGINVNITLLFGLQAYRETHLTHIRALERRLADGLGLERVSSVASFFLSRIDVAVDEQLERMAAAPFPEAEKETARQLMGKTAVAYAKLAYRDFQEIISSERWGELDQRGARPQRIVWASTGTKNPDYSDVMYIDPLIGDHTISTIPSKTANAFNDHGNPGRSIEEGFDEARAIIDQLGPLGIDIEVITQRLVEEGVDKFISAYDRLLDDIRGKQDQLIAAVND
ncbi:MAG: transaldolase [Candidatus Thiodiazotropha sp.]